MATIRKIFTKYKFEILITVGLILVGVLAALGRGDASRNRMSDILFFSSEEAEVIVCTLAFPLVMLIVYALVKHFRKKFNSVGNDDEWELIECLRNDHSNGKETKEEIEIDTYKTLTAMSEALAEQAYDNSPFILSIVNSEGKGQVSICGDTKNALHLVDEILTGISRRLKDEGFNEMQAFELLGIMVAGVTDKVYEDQRIKRNPFRHSVSDDETQKIDFDLNNFLEGD